MLGRLFGNKDPDRGSDQEYLGPLRALLSTVESVIKEVADIEDNLSDTYPPQAFSNLSRKFEQIGKDFTKYHRITRNSHYAIIHKSAARLKATKNVVREARTVAKLFERYAQRPRTYSASYSRGKITDLQTELENLRACCEPDG
jgi:hypothetical protein